MGRRLTGYWSLARVPQGRCTKGFDWSCSDCYAARLAAASLVFFAPLSFYGLHQTWPIFQFPRRAPRVTWAVPSRGGRPAGLEAGSQYICQLPLSQKSWAFEPFSGQTFEGIEGEALCPSECTGILLVML